MLNSENQTYDLKMLPMLPCIFSNYIFALFIMKIYEAINKNFKYQAFNEQSASLLI